MKIQVLGTGCPKCKLLIRNTEEALRDLGRSEEVEKVTDLDVIMDYGVMMTPALVVDGDVKSVGKVLSAADIKQLVA